MIRWLMAARSCRVTIHDTEGISHTVEVTAASLFEAVAQGLAAFRGNEWITDLGERFGVVKVSVAEVRVEHEVKIKDFTTWLERPPRSPREVTDRQKIRAILGMPVTR
jgi:hypothetical protein